MRISFSISVTDERELTSAQKAAFLRLAIACFLDVTADEAEEEFCCEPVARVLATRRGELFEWVLHGESPFSLGPEPGYW